MFLNIHIKLNVFDADYAWLKIVCVINRLVFKTYFVIPNDIAPVVHCCKSISELRPPSKELVVKYRALDNRERHNCS